MMEKGTVITLEKGKYEITGRIGEGAYGVVWEVRRIPDREMFALKTVQTRDDRGIYSFHKKEKVLEKLKIEIAFLKNFSAEEALAHHIVPLVDSGVYEENPVMVMMRCDHDLNTVYGKRVKNLQTFPFDAQTFLGWIAQTAKALLKIHSTQTKDKSEDKIYALRDLKFENVLFKNGVLYLTDFGTVKPIMREKPEGNITASMGCTPEWAAPEMLIPVVWKDNEPEYSFSPNVDVYALGLIIYALITGSSTAAQKQLGRYPYIVNLKPGEVGGLTGKEMLSLRENLWRLFNPGGGTIGFGVEKICSLPDTDFLVTELCTLTESMLAPRAENRPSSAKVVDKSRELLDFLAPDLKELRLKMPSPLSFGKKQKIYVQAVGKGLPRSGNWLHLSVNEEPVNADFRPVPEKNQVWESDLPVFDKEGKYEIEVFAIVHHEKISCVQTAEVSASAEQLWQKGLYAQALIKKPDKWEWLNDLEKKFGKSEEYLKILEDVLEVHPKHTDINRRYWPLKHDIESRVGKSGALPTNGGSPHSDENDFRHSGEGRNPDKVGNAPLLPTLQKSDKKRKTIGKWLAAGLCLIVLCAGGWALSEPGFSGFKRFTGFFSSVSEPEPEPAPPDPMEEKRRAAGEIWKTIQEYLQSGETEKAKNLLTEKKSGLEILPEAAEQISLLEEFFIFYDKAGKAGKAETSQEQEKIVSDYEKAAEISGKLSISSLHDAVSEKLKAAESVRNDLLAEEKKEQERIAGEKRLKKEEQERIAEAERKRKEEERLKAEAEQQQKRTEAEARYAEIVKAVNSGKWEEAGSMISQNRDLLKNWLDSEKYNHISQMETFFGLMTDAEKLRARTEFSTPEDFAPVLALYEKAKQIALKLPAEIKLSVRIQGKMNELTTKRDELLAKIQKEKEEQERVQKQKEAEGIYANILRAVKNGDRDTAENAISGNRSLLSTYLDKTKARHIRSLENFWKYSDEGDRLAGKKPETAESMKAAAEAYGRAETIAENLAGTVSLEDSVSGKQEKAAAKREELLAAEKKEQERIAEEKRKKEEQERIRAAQEEQDSGAVAGKTVKAKDGRFIAYTDGTVLDTRTNLMWAAKDNGKDIDWNDAKAYCRNYTGGGYSDWRMPTVKELQNLYDGNITSSNPPTGGCDGGYHITELIHLTCCCPWSSDTKDGGSLAAFVSFYHGLVRWSPLSDSNGARVLPVRVGK